MGDYKIEESLQDTLWDLTDEDPPEGQPKDEKGSKSDLRRRLDEDDVVDPDKSTHLRFPYSYIRKLKHILLRRYLDSHLNIYFKKPINTISKWSI